MTAETVTTQTTAADPAAEATDTGPVTASLSPSRAADFKTCPLLYRFRSIDRLPERPSAEQARGTLVHAVLERLFDLPAEERTPATAASLVAPEWSRLLAEQPELAELFPAEDAAGAAEFLDSARDLLDGYFRVEDPRRLEPAERESLVSAVVDDRLLIRGYIDRLDVSPDGALRVVDYKTGGAPREAFEARALFQLKFYALVLWRTRGVVPAVLRLLYLKDAEVCDYRPDADELVRFERTVVALWRAIEQATAARDFRPKPSRLCDWCNYQAHCPAFGGTPPPFPEPLAADPSSPAPPARVTRRAAGATPPAQPVGPGPAGTPPGPASSGDGPGAPPESAGAAAPAR
jgi:putative RecB family exonuclease